MPIAQGARKRLLAGARATYRKRAMRRTVLAALADPHFPLVYFLHNLVALQSEPWWQRLPKRVRKARIRCMLWERSAFFREMKQWLEERKEWKPGQTGFERAACRKEADSYCTQCGVCCELASGFPDFPESAAIPKHWQGLFGDGLGRGHRFCPFLWEGGIPGIGQCAIHPWRPNPCRIFEEEECERVLRDPGFIDPADPAPHLRFARRLARLIDGR